MAVGTDEVREWMTRLGLHSSAIAEVEKCEIKMIKLLVVEGNHERDFFKAWLGLLRITDIQVMPIGGKTNLSANLQALVRQQRFREVVSLVIVRDADDDPGSAFRSVCSALQAVAIAPLPAASWAWHTLANPRNTAVQMKACVLVLPDASSNGALEELLMQTVAGDPMYGDAVGLISGAVAKLSQPTSPRQPPPAHRHGKARAHAFLSTFEAPDKDQGKAAASGVWDFAHPALNPLEQMLRAM